MCHAKLYQLQDELEELRADLRDTKKEVASATSRSRDIEHQYDSLKESVTQYVEAATEEVWRWPDKEGQCTEAKKGGEGMCTCVCVLTSRRGMRLRLYDSPSTDSDMSCFVMFRMTPPPA